MTFGMSGSPGAVLAAPLPALHKKYDGTSGRQKKNDTLQVVA